MALDEFIRDAYGEARILRAASCRPVIYGSTSWFRSCRGPAALRPWQVTIPASTWVRVDGRLAGPRRNLRVPSGAKLRARVEACPGRPRPGDARRPAPRARSAISATPGRGPRATVFRRRTTVLLTPGPANAAYYEHCELAG